MQQILAQFALEVFRAYAKAREAASAEGVDLDALLAKAASDNDQSVFDVLGIAEQSK